MKSISWASAISMVPALAFVAVIGCGGQSESGAAGDDGSGLAQEAAEGEGEARGGMEGGEGAEGGEHEEGREGGGEGGEGEEGGEHREGGEHDEGGEHAEGGEHGGGGEGEEGEEGGDYIGRAENWDATRRGMRLTLAYDAARDAFVGMVENTTDAMICAVRVEVHLEGGPELGPTGRQDVGAGESVSVELSAEGEGVERWTAHPESSACGG